MLFGLTWRGRLRAAESERVADVAGATSARRRVINDVAVGVPTAYSDARIPTLVPDAGLGRLAVVTRSALRSASLIRVSQVFGNAGAGSCSVLLAADRVSSAR